MRLVAEPWRKIELTYIILHRKLRRDIRIFLLKCGGPFALLRQARSIGAHTQP